MKNLVPALLLQFISCTLAQAAELKRFGDVDLVHTGWADGDSFLVRDATGDSFTIRLYGVDCLEWHVADESDARRLRAQRRYFGIAGYGGQPAESITLAKGLGEAASRRVREWLKEPFVVHTAHADARGDGRYKRVYAFVTTASGEDLAEKLVRTGLARAYGVSRMSPSGMTSTQYREWLQDLELVAAMKKVGIWSYTDWDSLANERVTQRLEEHERQLALGSAEPTRSLNVNEAARDALMGVPGIGEVTANRIIEGRPYTSLEDLLQVRGIGPTSLARIAPWLHVEGKRGEPDVK